MLQSRIGKVSCTAEWICPELGKFHAPLHAFVPNWESFPHCCMPLSRFGKFSCSAAWICPGLGKFHAPLHGFVPFWESSMHRCMKLSRFYYAFTLSEAYFPAHNMPVPVYLVPFRRLMALRCTRSSGPRCHDGSRRGVRARLRISAAPEPHVQDADGPEPL